MITRRHLSTILACLLVFACGARLSFASFVNCDAPRSDTGSVLYLYYPNSSDSNFPNYSVGTSPLAEFDVNDLDSGIDESDLIDRISQLVRRHYCEFDIRIVQTRTAVGTTNPNPTETRWQVIGIGSDAKAVGNGNLFGVAQSVDLGDVDAQDFARVWADSFGAAYGGAGGVLNGANSTLERWANAIAGTVSHEGGHNYGLQHSDSAAVTGEDGTNNHVLATGSTGLNGEGRTQYRHFSNTSFEVLAANLGLYEKTLTNWCFVNPNSTDADGFNIIVLVLPADGTPSKTSMYTGGLSPWSDVSISADGAETHQGTNYNRFKIEFTTPKAWNNGAAGVVPAGIDFHVGVSIDKNNIVRDTEFTSGGSALALKPRVPGYDVSSTFDAATGNLSISIFNFDFEQNGPLLLSPARVRRLPRTVQLDHMVQGGRLVDAEGRLIQPWEDEVRGETTTLNERGELIVGALSEGRIIDKMLEQDADCRKTGDPIGPFDAEGFDFEYCPTGCQVSLFPSARIYVEMTVTDPNATFFNPATGQMEQGPLDTHLFFQVPGQKPDFNENGVDDGIEILEGTLVDENKNGVPDPFEPGVPTVSEWGMIILILLLLTTATIAIRRGRLVVARSRGQA